MTNQMLEKRRKTIETVAKVGAVCVTGFIVGPFVFLTIQGILGLIVAGGVSLVAINLTPWFSSKVANWRLKALKHEAALNPIETLQNQYKERLESIQRFRDHIKTFAASVQNFQGKLGEFKTKYPKDSQKFDQQCASMRQLLESRKAKYETAKVELLKFEGEIEKASAIWDMAKEAAAMNKEAGVNTDEFYAKVQVETALDSVQKGMATAFADLELSLLDEKGSAPQIDTKPIVSIPAKTGTPTLDLEIDSPSKVYAR